jgi:hypothetical protein
MRQLGTYIEARQKRRRATRERHVREGRLLRHVSEDVDRGDFEPDTYACLVRREELRDQYGDACADIFDALWNLGPLYMDIDYDPLWSCTKISEAIFERLEHVRTLEDLEAVVEYELRDSLPVADNPHTLIARHLWKVWYPEVRVSYPSWSASSFA